MAILALDHLQLAMPEGREDDAREFFSDLLGFAEVEKPESLAGRGGGWFRSGTVTLHIGIDKDFRPAKKAHPAFLVDDAAALRRKLEAAGCATVDDVPLPGYERFFVHDPFGNRIELMQRLAAGKNE